MMLEERLGIVLTVSVEKLGKAVIIFKDNFTNCYRILLKVYCT